MWNSPGITSVIQTTEIFSWRKWQTLWAHIPAEFLFPLTPQIIMIFPSWSWLPNWQYCNVYKHCVYLYSAFSFHFSTVFTLLFPEQQVTAGVSRQLGTRQACCPTRTLCTCACCAMPLLTGNSEHSLSSNDVAGSLAWRMLSVSITRAWAIPALEWAWRWDSANALYPVNRSLAIVGCGKRGRCRGLSLSHWDWFHKLAWTNLIGLFGKILP